jgi:hypothetical protein
MIQFKDDTEESKIYREMLDELPEIKIMNKSYKLGVASVVHSIHEWCDSLKKRGINSVAPEEIKNSFLDWVSSDIEVNMLFNRLQGNLYEED